MKKRLLIFAVPLLTWAAEIMNPALAGAEANYELAKKGKKVSSDNFPNSLYLRFDVCSFSFLSVSFNNDYRC